MDRVPRYARADRQRGDRASPEIAVRYLSDFRKNGHGVASIFEPEHSARVDGALRSWTDSVSPWLLTGPVPGAGHNSNNRAARLAQLSLCSSRSTFVAGSYYGSVINRTGTGEEPVTVGVVSVAVLLHPATFSTVTLTLPPASMPLMNTCRNPTILTGTVP